MPTIDALSDASPVDSAHGVEGGVGGWVHEGVDHDAVALRGQVIDALPRGRHRLVGLRLLVPGGGQA
jgi:hypothetical protein